jgi:hypothetical protein
VEWSGEWWCVMVVCDGGVVRECVSVVCNVWYVVVVIVVVIVVVEREENNRRIT